MRLVKVAVASVKTNVGATKTNIARALAMAMEMESSQVTLGVFQEQLVGGYPPEDLVQWRAFIDAQRTALDRFVNETRAMGCAFVIGLAVEHGAHRYNAAATIHRGRILGVVPKEKLPTYNVFYEARTFSRGLPHFESQLDDGTPFGDLIFRFDWGLLGVEVCEDAWSPDGPMRRRAFSGAEIIANVSASPFRIGVQATRREMLSTRSADNQCTVVYANAVGGQDGLVFDGGGVVCQNGRVVAEATRFRAGWEATVIDLDRTARLRAENTTWRDDAQSYRASQRAVRIIDALLPGASREALGYPVPSGRSFFLPAAPARPDARVEFCEELLDALSLGLGDYFEKNQFRLIGIALSGGRDSLLALLVAWRYLRQAGKPLDVLRTFYMPTRFSSDVTRKAAETIIRELGVPFTVIPIEEAFERELEAACAMLAPGETLTQLTMQNAQARIRAARMWNWSNATSGLYVQTGNMSEKAVGYTTIGGDLAGGLSVISNVPKTVVAYLLAYLHEQLGFAGIGQVLAYPAGPELAEHQEGEKELMPFPILDACFVLYAGEKLAPRELASALASIFPEVPREVLDSHANRFLRMFHGSIYKWVQAPLGLHVGNLDLDRERALQLPVVSSSDWWQKGGN